MITTKRVDNKLYTIKYELLPKIFRRGNICLDNWQDMILDTMYQWNPKLNKAEVIWTTSEIYDLCSEIACMTRAYEYRFKEANKLDYLCANLHEFCSPYKYIEDRVIQYVPIRKTCAYDF